MTVTDAYLNNLQSTLAAGDSTEHSHRPALKAWLEALKGGIVATNEPRRVAAGAPDFNIGLNRSHGHLSIGKVEAKDIGVDLEAIELDSNRASPLTSNGEQLKRYRGAFDNLLLTDYVEFKWFRHGELVQSAKLAHASGLDITGTGDPARAIQIVLDFLDQRPLPIRSARQLAERMARMTDLLQEVVLRSLLATDPSEELAELYKAFGEVLVPGITESQFADLFSQTLSYGLFAARVRHHPDNGPFQRTSAATEIPRTNPFLRKLFQLAAGPHLEDEPFVGLVDDLAQLLDDADMPRILKDFGTHVRKDPIVHFYETFLAAYDPKLRDVRGVYYTPEPVVRFIVHSIDNILIDTFGISSGFADTSKRAGVHRVLVLDPACGTGTFLYSVVDLVRARIGSVAPGAWSEYVRQELLPRLFGFELMMAPYAVAHLKMGMQLAGLDLPEAERASLTYDFATDQRTNIYLTNTLDPGTHHPTLPFATFLSTEANEANAVKTEKPIMVVIGNPPYQGSSWNSSWRLESRSSNEGRRSTRRTNAQQDKVAQRLRRVPSYIGTLLQAYFEIQGEPLGERNSKWLQDDYVKFIRFGQDRIDHTGQGVLGFVTNHTYLDAPTFRGMRENLLRSFDDIFILNLHGNQRRRERSPDGTVDENVFDQIMQGVAIAIFVKNSSSSEHAKVHYAERWGRRDDKYSWLEANTTNSTEWIDFVPEEPFFGFRPEDSDIRAEWNLGRSLPEIFPVYTTGIVTSRDSLVIDTDLARLKARIDDFIDPTTADETVRTRYFPGSPRTRADGKIILSGDTESWLMGDRRREIYADADRGSAFRKITYRPFDDRFIFYHEDAIERPRMDVMRHMVDVNNIGLVSARSNKSSSQDQFFVSRNITEAKTGESTTQSVLFPLWVKKYPSGELPFMDAAGGAEIASNIDHSIRLVLESNLGLKWCNEPMGDLTSTFGAEDVLAYVYAIVQSRAYRSRYLTFLSREYARIPFTRSVELFRELAVMGHKLMALHLGESEFASLGFVKFPVAGTSTVDPGFPKFVAEGETGISGSELATEPRLYINSDQYFAGVTLEEFDFRIGGHQVLDKWLKARRGAPLKFSDIEHVILIIESIQSTIELQDELDDLIHEWPID